ncbi:TRAP transporter large permease [Fulvimarina sp. 2208YS6-2-32]|uniref:TRAP transporter large permease protein n=1 Tax=Fulvimarina uroteuthidis TaxID=3098149 RepID=A0ABU5I1N1_9HYPH|nr:TRAP transporter large permease [Fulvimarina sp. 2208YS6-2-32]MDY8108888.1 TRAP transporter large permease [Fulvimarina sp. 2208YS6-2-32]
MILLLMVLALLALILINVPIGIALGVVAAIAIIAADGTASIPNIALTLYEGSRNFPLIAIPMFILAGAIMNTGGISRRLIDFASSLIGFVRGGLAHVNIVTSMFFAEISGSAVADVAATGPILMPAMIRNGFPRAFAAAVSSSSASLAIIIPPSIPMILYGVMSGSSIVQLFVAGIIPGILGGFSMMGVSYYMARRYNWPVEQKFRWARVKSTFREAVWAFILPMIILGAIFGGFLTATEGAGLAVVVALFLSAVIYKELDMRFLWQTAVDGAVQTAVVMILVATSALLGAYLTEQRIPQELARGILDFTDDPLVVLMILNVFFLLIGMFLHSAAAIILVVPIVMPLINAVGIDPVHFGLIVTLNLAIGQQTPPVASVLVTACSIAKADIWEVTKANTWFIVTLIVLLLLVTYVPAIPMTLVDYFYR